VFLRATAATVGALIRSGVQLTSAAARAMMRLVAAALFSVAGSLLHII
jgi:hypothetical protein